MKDEINNYNITNHDGVSLADLDGEKKISFSNDDPRFVAEDSTSQVSEWDRSVPEDSCSAEKTRSKRSDETNRMQDGGEYNNVEPSGGDVGSSSSASSSMSSAVSSGTTSVASALGGSMGALASVVATSVVAALVVVVAFVSTMTMNVTLAMSEMTRLVFNLELNNAQEEDFSKPIIASLEGNGYHFEQEIYSDTVYLTFEGLEPGKEYLLKIYNDEKVFFKKSYITATEEVERGSIEAFVEHGEAFIYVQNIALKNGEYYTLTVKDADGNVIFVKDSTDVNAEYRVALSGNKDVYYTVTVNGAVYAIAETQADVKPEYDLENIEWIWNGNDVVRVSITDKKGGEPLVLNAVVTSEIVANADCEKGGIEKFIATVEFEGQRFTEDKVVSTAPLGHEYGEIIPPTATCEEGGIAAHYECSVCHKIFDYKRNETTLDALAVSALGHEYGELHEAVETDCEHDGNIAYYHCENCGKYFDEEYSEVADVVIEAVGHVYGEIIPENYDGNGLAAHYECSVCHKLFDEDLNETTADALRLQVPEGEQQIIDVGFDVGRITAEMVPDNSDHPSGDLFPGFVPYSFEEVSSWHAAINGEFYLLYDFDDQGFYVVKFENGSCVQAEGYHDIDTTNAGLLEMISDGMLFYYTVEESGNGGQEAGLVMVTLDTLPNNDEYPTAELFVGFVEVSLEDAQEMNVPGEASYLICRIDDGWLYLCSFQNGVCSLYELVSYQLTNANIIESIGQGYNFYYYSSGSQGGQGSQTGIGSGDVFYVGETYDFGEAKYFVDNNGGTIAFEGIQTIAGYVIMENSGCFQVIDDFENSTFWNVTKDLSIDPPTSFTIADGHGTSSDPFYIILGYESSQGGGQGSGEANFDIGDIQEFIIRSDGYVINEENYAFVSSENAPYVLSGSLSSEQGIVIDGSGKLDYSLHSGNATYYVTFDGLSVYSQGHPLKIACAMGYEVDVYINVVNSSVLSVVNAPAICFSIYEGGYINVYITTSDPSYFIWNTAGLYETELLNCDADTAGVNVYIDGVLFGADGQPAGGGQGGQGGEQQNSQACEISLEEGAICINANGYARSKSGLSNPTPFVSSATNPYLIQNQNISGCDNIIQVYQNDSSIQTADIYIKLNNVRIEASSWASLFLIKATNTVNIYLIIEGEVTFVGGSGQQIFSSQEYGSPTVNIIIDQTTFGGTFNAEISDGLTYAQSGTINVSYV